MYQHTSLPVIGSLLIALALLQGVIALGLLIIARIGPLQRQAYSFRLLQAPLIGLCTLAFTLYPVALVGYTTRALLQGVGVGVILLGFVYFIVIFVRKGVQREWPQSFRRVWASNSTVDSTLIVLLLGGYFFLSLGPVTNADSLDYHVGVALRIVAEGGMPVVPSWFHSRLAGSGEVVNAIALAVGAEQFTGLIQFSAIASLFASLALFDTKNRASSGRIFNAIVGLSVPVLVFLISSAKPQLLPIAMTTLATRLVIDAKEHRHRRVEYLALMAVVLVLASGAAQMKYSFLLGGGIVGILCLVVASRHKHLVPVGILALVIATVAFVPGAVWKSYHFGGSIVSAMIEPFSGDLPGYDAFEAFLRSYRDSPVAFPLSLVMPSSFGTITTVLGPVVLCLLFVRVQRDFEHYALLTAVAVFLVVSVVLGQRTSRFFLEPFYWLLLLPIQTRRPKLMKTMRLGLYGQAAATALLAWYGAALVFPGSLSRVQRDRVLEQTAVGYPVMRWVDTVLPQDAVLLSGHRSIALAPRPAESTDWTRFVGFDTAGFRFYADLVNQRGITHVLVINPDVASDQLLAFVGDAIATPFVGYRATRNPFNRGDEYRAVIYEFVPFSEP